MSVKTEDQTEEVAIEGTLSSFRTNKKNDEYIIQAVIRSGDDTVLCIWQQHERNPDLSSGRTYRIIGRLNLRQNMHVMVKPEIKLMTEPATSVKRTSTWRPLKISLALGIALLIFSGIAGTISDNLHKQNPNTVASATYSDAPSDSVSNVGTSPSTVNTNTSQIDIDKLLGDYSSTYDTSTHSYNLNYNDLKSYLGSSSNSSLSKSLSSLYGSGTTYRSGNETWHFSCSQYTGNCTAYSSSGASAQTYCSKYINSCSTYGSDGSTANTYCSSYTSSCSTYGSGGYSSNTYCSQYTNSCSTYGSDGTSSTTYCSSYSSSCNTYGTNGYSNTYCSSYTSSCSSYSSSW